MEPWDAAPARLADVAWRPPRLETTRVVLRGFEDDDVEAVFAYASDPEVARYMLWACHRTIADTHAFFTMTAGDYARHALSYALALRSEPDVAIGGASLVWRSDAHGTMELGYVLARPYWGQGLLPEAARALLRHAFDTTSVHRIYAPIFAANQKSRRAAEKIGLTFDGVLRESLLVRGQRWDEAVYSILRGELA